MERTTIGNRIREIRRQAGLNQTQFGKLINVSQDNVSLWERDKSSPAADQIVAIIKTFSPKDDQISADWLLGLIPDDRL